MNSGKALLASIREDLRAGQIRLALLGNKGELHILVLDSPEAMARYADMMKASIAGAVRNNKKLQWIAVVGLALLFTVATFLSVLVHLRHWGWAASMALAT